MDAENDFDEYFDKNEIEEYISIVNFKVDSQNVGASVQVAPFAADDKKSAGSS